MNLAELFIKRPITTTLIMLGIIVFGVMAYQLLPVSDLPTVDFPTIQVNAEPARREPGDDGVGGRAAAREAVRDHRRPRLDQLDQLAGQHQHHAAVRSEPQHRRRRAGRAGDDRAGGAAAAAADAGAAVVPEGQSRRPAGDLPGAALGDAAAVDVNEYAEDDRAAHLDGQRRRAGAGVRRREVRGARRRRSAQARRPTASASTKSRPPIQNANVNLPTGTMYGAQQTFTVLANGQLLRAAAYGPMIVAYRNGNPVRLERSRARLRRRRERQDRPPGTRASAPSTWRFRSSRAPTSSRSSTRSRRCCRRSASSCRRGLARHPHRSLGRDPRVGPRRQARRCCSPSRWSSLVIFLFLRNVSATIIPSLALPVSIVATFAVMYLLDYSLDNLSLMALTLVRRLRRRRRDRDAGEHRPAHGDGQAADAGGVRRLEGSRLHDPVDDACRWPRCSSRCCSWAASSAGCCTSSRSRSASRSSCRASSRSASRRCCAAGS